MKSFWQDLRYGVRMLVKNPGFTAVVIVTLALGIGANTAIFTVVNAVLIQPLPYQDPDGLVRITSDMQKLQIVLFFYLLLKLPLAANGEHVEASLQDSGAG
jgi:putative ABC transport system permease protein